MKIKQRHRIALLIETSNAYGRGLMRGINTFIHEHHPWALYLGEYSRGNPDSRWLSHWQGDGIIARIDSQSIADRLAATGLPVINVSSAWMDQRFPIVETNDRMIADLAAHHLMALGLKHFAFCGNTYNWSRWRGTYFQQVLQQHQFQCTFFETENVNSWASGFGQLSRWIHTLPKPVGIFSAYDSLARQLIEVCQQKGVLVPEEIAVIGVDNDELICELCDPPLTSVMPDPIRTGYVAASLLQQLFDGRALPDSLLQIEPLGVIRRRSTDIKAIHDLNISKAIHLIHQHAHQKLSISQLLAQIPLSRRVFEKRFKKQVGHSPHHEIQRVRIERVKTLLIETDLSQPEIAERAGFEYVNYMNSLFKKWTGIPPGLFRRQHR